MSVLKIAAILRHWSPLMVACLHALKYCLLCILRRIGRYPLKTPIMKMPTSHSVQVQTSETLPAVLSWEPPPYFRTCVQTPELPTAAQLVRARDGPGPGRGTGIWQSITSPHASAMMDRELEWATMLLPVQFARSSSIESYPRARQYIPQLGPLGCHPEPRLKRPSNCPKHDNSSTPERPNRCATS